MATIETTDLRLELPAERTGVLPRPSATPAARRGLRPARRVQPARLQALAIVAASLLVGVASGSSLRSQAQTVCVLALSWLSTIGLVERSLRGVRAVAGQVGSAVCEALAGAAIASLLSYWLGLGVSGQAAVLTMTGLVGAIILGVQTMQARSSGLRVLLVGGNESSGDLVRLLGSNGTCQSEFTLAGWVAGDDEADIPGVRCLGSVAALGEIVTEQDPDLVVVAADRGRPAIFGQLASVADQGFRVVGLPEFYEHAFGYVPIRNLTDAWFMSVLHLYQASYSRAAKRAFDVAVACFGLALTSPLLPVIALLVRLTGGPVFYRQVRIGEHGRPFTILKFRTMTVDAEPNGPVWALEGDPRTTSIGRILRRTRLDEIPQLINVLRGEMSIVGPRPERPEFFDMLHDQVPFWSRRHLLKPGITGWAQLRAAYAADAQATEEKLAYDLWYLRHRSLLVDLLICIRTLPMLVLAAGR